MFDCSSHNLQHSLVMFYSIDMSSPSSSLREKTHAHRRLDDNVPEDVKQARLQELIDMFHKHARVKNSNRIGTEQIVLIEAQSKRSELEVVGRTDGNLKAVMPREFVDEITKQPTTLRTGDYVVIKVEDSTSMTLRGKPLIKSSLQNLSRLHNQ
eukprot:m.23734 g.23734  ORF g.23734 m.23734 type:complete len:154 (-) comp5576_c0_seq1:132-593(-)